MPPRPHPAFRLRYDYAACGPGAIGDHYSVTNTHFLGDRKIRRLFPDDYKIVLAGVFQPALGSHSFKSDHVVVRRQQAGGKGKRRAGNILAPDPLPIKSLDLRPVALVDGLRLHIELQPYLTGIRPDEQRLLFVGAPDEARRQDEAEKGRRLLRFS